MDGQLPLRAPSEIDPEYHRSLAAFVEECVQPFAHHPAFRSFGQTLTYADLERLSLAFAAYIQQSFGLKKGDRIAIMLPNVLRYPIVLFGALRARLVPTVTTKRNAKM